MATNEEHDASLPKKTTTVLQRITSEEGSLSAEQSLRSAFSEGADFAGEVSLGYRGGSRQARLYWHESESIWACIDESGVPQATRFWNAFGVGDPRTASPTIVCEVNPPRSGVNRAVAGVFAVDPSTGERFLLHNGRIGGGREGVGPEAFKKHFEGDFVALEGEPGGFALVAPLDDGDVVARVAKFVRAVSEVKALATGGPESGTVGSWWVNQGKTYAQESAGGYVWAPQAKDGKTQVYWTNVSRLSPGDTIVHYARKFVRALGTVVAAPFTANKPGELQGPWERQGWMAKVQYRELDPPIPLDDIPVEWRAGRRGPFDRNGNVNQGYLWRLPAGFLDEFEARFRDRLLKQTDSPANTILVAAGGPKSAWLSDEVTLTAQLKTAGSAAMWFSFPLKPEHEAILDMHPWVYIYVGQKTSAIAARAHVISHQTLPGGEGLASPWPDATPEAWRDKTRLGEAANQLFKTWLLIDNLETLDPPFSAAEFVTHSGQPADGSFLHGGFGVWTRKSPEAPASPEEFRMDELSRECHVPVAELEELVSMLREKRQLILEGPPGSGKTFLAGLLARFMTDNPLMGDHDKRVGLVQFHQSYGYEDFIQGIRPRTNERGQLEYRVEDGIFKRFSAKASADSAARPYVLVIDEINRGNLSRIFGELLLLLEYRKSSVALPYSYDGEPFQIPENLYVIGTMNTTDRSLAQIDYALRRRFYFYRLLPTSDGDAPVLRGWLEKNVERAVDRSRVLSIFLALNEKLRGELGVHYQVGHSYFMVKDIGTHAGLDRVWRRALAPLLEEYFYNRKDREALVDGFAPEKLVPTTTADNS